MKGKSATGCTNFKECGFKVPFDLMGKKLSDNQLKDLIEKKKTGWIKGITDPSNQEKIEGRFLMDEQFNIQFDKKDS
jgi:DNA topoisomerase-3